MNLEDTMASLKINEVSTKIADFEKHPDNLDTKETPPEPPERRRSTRLKSRVTYTEKRRVFTKPVKIPKDKRVKDTENYYLDKRFKRLSPTLETIYEDSPPRDGANTHVASRKPQRVNFSTGFTNNLKIKKSKMKSKSVSSYQRVNKRHKIPLKYLLDKLAEIRDE